LHTWIKPIFLTRQKPISIYAAAAYIETGFCQVKILHKALQINENIRLIYAAPAYIEIWTWPGHSFCGWFIARRRFAANRIRRSSASINLLSRASSKLTPGKLPQLPHPFQVSAFQFSFIPLTFIPLTILGPVFLNLSKGSPILAPKF